MPKQQNLLQNNTNIINKTNKIMPNISSAKIAIFLYSIFTTRIQIFLQKILSTSC